MKVAIIPARGGSKRIPNKNIRLFMGKPLIYYAIKEALATKIFDKIIVSTDSDEIAMMARKFGAETPFQRPLELSDDFTPTLPVIKHALSWLIDRDYRVEYCCSIYANPFVIAKNIKEAFNMLLIKDATSILPVYELPINIYRSLNIDKNGLLEFVFPENSLKRSQDLKLSYQDAGQFCWWNSDRLMATENNTDLQQKNRFPIILPRDQVQDIDSLDDW